MIRLQITTSSFGPLLGYRRLHGVQLLWTGVEWVGTHLGSSQFLPIHPGRRPRRINLPCDPGDDTRTLQERTLREPDQERLGDPKDRPSRYRPTPNRVLTSPVCLGVLRVCPFSGGHLTPQAYFCQFLCSRSVRS